MTNKERFISLFSCVDREGKDELLKWLETSDFYTAPASAKYHGTYEGGVWERVPCYRFEEKFCCGGLA